MPREMSSIALLPKVVRSFQAGSFARETPLGDGRLWLAIGRYFASVTPLLARVFLASLWVPNAPATLMVRPDRPALTGLPAPGLTSHGMLARVRLARA